VAKPSRPITNRQGRLNEASRYAGFQPRSEERTKALLEALGRFRDRAGIEPKTETSLALQSRVQCAAGLSMNERRMTLRQPDVG
jgi:hypothetical protein